MEWFEDEYNEVFTEPSEADKIISKAVDELSALLTEEAKNSISAALEAKRKQGEAEDKLRKLERKINHTESYISELEEKCEEALKKADETEIRDIPRRYLNRMVREAIGDYAPGDKVWFLRPVYEHTECPLCHGEKEVDANINGNKARVKCPECGGYGAKGKTVYHVEDAEIKEIRLKLCFDKERAMYWNHENIYLYGRERSTPIDSIFATKEEAEKALEKSEKEN